MIEDVLAVRLRLACSGNESRDYRVGRYYFNQDTRARFFANATLPDPGSSFATRGNLPVNGNEAAAFTYNTVNLITQWLLEVGLRRECEVVGVAAEAT